MFSEISSELISIFKQDNAIISIPTVDAGIVASNCFSIKSKQLIKTSKIEFDKKCGCTTYIILHNKDTDKIEKEVTMYKSEPVLAIAIPEKLINNDEKNAVVLSNAIVVCTSHIVSTCIKSLESYADESMISLVIYQAVPVIVADVLKHIYTGNTLPLLLCEALRNSFTGYLHDNATKEWMESVFKLLNESSVEDLLDNGFITLIGTDSEEYPGMWPTKNKEAETDND